jgi:23S rRNA (cytidine1920-2'-O)/16S rRNA (cytidine1409-2'-O)-methyltransferase
MARRGLVETRSQAESWIKLGKVTVDGKSATKPGTFVREDSVIKLTAKEQYVSRAGLKLASVAKVLGADFRGKTVLDVGSSTGGFTDYALQLGAEKVYAGDVGPEQLHPSLHGQSKIELHEKTDIRDFTPATAPDIVVIDVSFVSLRDILPHVVSVSGPHTQILAMVKPQFEAQRRQLGNSGVIKNETVRRQILKDFEAWSKPYVIIQDKSDSEVSGSRGNTERFYLLKAIYKKH